MIHDGDNSQRLDLSTVNAAIPRKVALQSGEARTFFGVVAFLLGSGILWFGFYACHVAKQVRQRESLRLSGHNAVGEVTKKGVSRSGVSIDYAFDVNSHRYFGVVLLPNDPRVDPKVGDSIVIRYLPTDPLVSHPDGWEWSAVPEIVPNLFMLFFTCLGASGVVMILRQRTLARKGRVVEGRVLSCIPKGNRFSVDYEFRTTDGATEEGKNDFSDEYARDSGILVIYLPSSPARNGTYPLSSYRTMD